MAPVLRWLILFLCLLITIAKYKLGPILKWSSPEAKVAKDDSYQPSVSVILCCYNEGRAVYDAIESLSRSDYPNHLFEIAQDNCSVDDSYRSMLEAQRDVTSIRISAGRK